MNIEGVLLVLKHEFLKGFRNQALRLSTQVPRKSYHVLAFRTRSETKTGQNVINARCIHTWNNMPLDKLAETINTYLKHNGVTLCEKCQHQLRVAVQNARSLEKNIQGTNNAQKGSPESVDPEQWLKFVQSPNTRTSPAEKSDDTPIYNYFGEKMSIAQFIIEEAAKVSSNCDLVDAQPKYPPQNPKELDIQILEQKRDVDHEKQVDDFDRSDVVGAKRIISVGVGPLPDIPMTNYKLADMLNHLLQDKENKQHGSAFQETDKPDMGMKSPNLHCLDARLRFPLPVTSHQKMNSRDRAN